MVSYHARHERHIDIPLRDGKYIHAILRGDFVTNAPIVVMMHGRPGSANELLQYLGARYLGEHGIATLRLSMYDFGSRYRSILDCTLDTHISDFDDVIEYLRQEGMMKIIALGHSYGGITILGSQAKLDGAVLWDPSHGSAWAEDDINDTDFPEVTIDDIVIGTGGQGYIHSRRQADEDKTVGDTTGWAKNKDYPMLFISAEASPLAKFTQGYYEVAEQPKAFIKIKGAHHQFEDNDDVMEALFSKTATWILSNRS